MKMLFWISFLCMFSCKSSDKHLIQPIEQDITESVYASGLVSSKNQYEVFSKVNGIIEKKLVSEGEFVHAGQVLMTIANEAPELNRENASLAAEYGSVAYNKDRLSQAETNLVLARQKLQNDSTFYQRQKRLWEEGIGTRNDLEQKQLAWKNALANYDVARHQLNDLKKQINFTAKQSAKNYQISTSLADDYHIKAIQEGRVYQILKEPGEMVTAQTPVAVLGASEDFILKLQVDEYDISKIKIGQRIFVSMDAFRGKTFQASVNKIQPIMDERTRSFEIEANFISAPENLYPNLTVEANILISTKKNALTIPRPCLLDDSTVLLADGKKRKVVTGLKDYQVVEIIDGLTKNDRIKINEK